MNYEYLCKNTECNFHTHIEHSMKDDFVTTCPECKQETLGRVITAGPVIMKGDGWTSNEKSGRYHPKGGT